MESLARLAPVGVSLLIGFLAYGSQALFPLIEPYDLEPRQKVIFNSLVVCIWICYARACLLDPGSVPPEWQPDTKQSGDDVFDPQTSQRSRWCKRCDNHKPPRAHHCKTCKRCIPKMDHHCPWTVNCVSHRTLPSFMRFLYYATVAMAYLEKFLWTRASVLWYNRNLPSYLGPSPSQLFMLFLFISVNSFTLFVVGVMFVRSAWSIGANTTTIESWEIDRHEVLLRRAKVLGGYLDGPDGIRVKIRRQEFPYDIGIWSNIIQGMNGGPITWFWPFATAPKVHNGMSFEVNEFEDASTVWPPPDPDRISKRPATGSAFMFAGEEESNEERLAAFRARQNADAARLQSHPSAYRRRAFHERYDDDNEIDDSAPENDIDGSESGEEAWRGGEGERLADFGLDEDAEFYDEDEVPLADLISRGRTKTQ